MAYPQRGCSLSIALSRICRPPSQTFGPTSAVCLDGAFRALASTPDSIPPRLGSSVGSHASRLMSFTSQSRRFEFVDALRGFAALAVVLPHAVGLFIYPHPSWLSRLFLWLAEYGAAGVEIFFVVSGF